MIDEFNKLSGSRSIMVAAEYILCTNYDLFNAIIACWFYHGSVSCTLNQWIAGKCSAIHTYLDIQTHSSKSKAIRIGTSVSCLCEWAVYTYYKSYVQCSYICTYIYELLIGMVQMSTYIHIIMHMYDIVYVCVACLSFWRQCICAPRLMFEYNLSGHPYAYIYLLY